MVERTSYYFDGFNVYHMIDRCCPDQKWLDLFSLAKAHLKPGQDLADVHYFSALSYWKQHRVVRHKRYINALRASGVSVILGRFKEKLRRCYKCKVKYVYHEEKQTDVNICLKIFEDAIEDKFDTAVIVSGDTDFEPVVRSIKQHFPKKRIAFMLPIGANAKTIRNVADYCIKLKRIHIQKNQFPPVVTTPKGEVEIPDEWKANK